MRSSRGKEKVVAAPSCATGLCGQMHVAPASVRVSHGFKLRSYENRRCPETRTKCVLKNNRRKEDTRKKEPRKERNSLNHQQVEHISQSQAD